MNAQKNVEHHQLQCSFKEFLGENQLPGTKTNRLHNFRIKERIQSTSLGKRKSTKSKAYSAFTLA